jgi:hypothetical protein
MDLSYSGKNSEVLVLWGEPLVPIMQISSRNTPIPFDIFKRIFLTSSFCLVSDD